jgi:hypothetical protein
MNYSLVGTAFDYLLRFCVQHLNPHLVTERTWIAEQSLMLLSHNSDWLAKGTEIVSTAKARLNIFLSTGEMTDQLIESALLLAGLDPIFRAGRGHEWIGHVTRGDVDDLKRLISVTDRTIFRAKSLCLINPSFGKASSMVGGADADLLIDETLMEIKTTKKLELNRDTFDQLIGYYALHIIAGVNELNPKPEIKTIAVYFSRYAYLHTINLNEVINPQSFPAFIEWFKERAYQEYGFSLF